MEDLSRKSVVANWGNYLDSMSHAASLPLADSAKGQKRIIGTATFLMTGLFLTAKHLVEQYFKDYESLDITAKDWTPQDNMEASFNLEVLQPLKGLDLVVWHITKVHIVPNSDLAILVAGKYSGDKASEVVALGLNVKIDLHMPPVGSRVISLGYPGTTNEGNNPSRHVLAMCTAEGVVEDVYTEVTSRSPRFQTNAPVDGGMSGGPVFNEQGLLCGINSTGILPTTDYLSYTSFAIPLHTAFMSRLSLNLNGTVSETSLFQLCKDGYITTVGMEHFIEDGDEALWDSKNIKCADCP